MDHDLRLSRLLGEEGPAELLLDSIFDGVYIVDTDRRILFWNRGAEEITGYAREDVVGRHCGDDILNHIDAEGVLLCRSGCPLMQCITTGEQVRAKIYPLHKDGHRFPVKTHVSPIRDQTGTIVAAIEVFRDISQEEELRILQEKFNEIIRRYVSSAAYEEALSRLQEDVQGRARIRDLTILCLDVVGFTRFAERHSPEDTARMLNDFFSICEVMTKEWHGDIDKFVGDAIVAVFVDANDAVAAGIRVLAGLSDLNRKRAGQGQDDIQIRIGVNSGLVLQAEIGTENRKDLTVIGDAVNTASRIEALAEPMSVCVSDATRSRLKDATGFQPYAKVKVKNREEPVSIFRYTSETQG